MRYFVLCAVALGLSAGPASAFDLGPESLNGWIDARAISADGERSWRAGGFGKLRHGGETRGEIAQAAVLWTPRLSDNVTAHVFLQAVPGTPAALSETYVAWKPVPTSDLRYSLRAGQMFPPISLEHDGPGWTTTRTLTPAALNAWIGEEVLVDGAEGTVQKTFGSHRVGATAGVFMGADTAGTSLTFRGWAQHDQVSGNATRLPLPDNPPGTGWAAVFTRQSAQSRPLVEVDGRAGGYVRLDWQPPAPVSFNLVVFDNPGNPEQVRHGQYAWTTRFSALGMRWRPDDGDEVLVQALGGLTKMGAVQADGTHPADIAYETAYALWSRSVGVGKLTGRVDYFAAKDHSLRALDDNTEKGYSATLAYIRPVSAHMDFAVEGVKVASNRPARVTQMLNPRQSQTQVQMALKLHL